MTPNLERSMTTMNNEDPADPSVHEQRELPEPAAWRVYFPDEQREEFASSLDDLLDDLTNCAHDDPEPLYTADQMREAIAAANQRADYWKAEHIAGNSEIDRLSAALAELVALKDMKDRLTELHEMGHGTDYGNYHKRRPLAWAAARAALSAQPEQTAAARDELRRYLHDTTREGTPNEQAVARTALHLLAYFDQP